ncbi:MAG: membrane dipeptidase [Planctomycetes bacterium]|nr:membrane dipeptidase [Planctomycetota bacterium]
MPNPSTLSRIDGHLDLAYLAMQGVDLESDSPDRAKFGVNFPALREGSFKLVFGTIFTEVGCDEPWGYADHADVEQAARAGRLQLRLYQGLEARGAIKIVRTQQDLKSWNEPGPLRVVILMEGADPIESPERAKWWFDQGVRMVGLTWAKGSRYAGGNSVPGELTEAGRKLVRALDGVGMIHDLSHLCDQACAEVIELATGPIVASHSNCRSLVPGNERHLTDETIRAIAARKGVCGLNLYGKFLAGGRAATLDDAVRHVKHVREVGGPERLALGSDFDGGFTPEDCPPNAQRPEDLPKIESALAQAGISTQELDGFRSGNWLRVLRTSLPQK